MYFMCGCYNNNNNKETILTGTLTIGETTLTLNDESIKSDSTIDVYSSVYGVSPKSVELSDGSITMTFKAKESDVDVKVVIR